MQKQKQNGRENCFTQLMPNIKICFNFFYIVNAELCLGAASILFNIYENFMHRGQAVLIHFGVIAEQEGLKKGGAPHPETDFYQT